MLPLGKELRSAVEKLGIIELISGCRFHTAISYLAYRRSGEVDWDAVDGEITFLNYDFEPGEAFHESSDRDAGQISLIDGLGRFPATYDFPDQHVHWITERECYRNQAEFLVLGDTSASMTLRVQTGGKLLIEPDEAQTVIDTLCVACGEVGIPEPTSVHVELCSAVAWARVILTSVEEKALLDKQLEEAVTVADELWQHEIGEEVAPLRQEQASAQQSMAQMI